MHEMSPIDWAMRPLKKYAVFTGRASRAEYWWFYLFYFIAMVALQFLVAISAIFAILGLAVLALVIPTIAVGVRRLHDINRTGWWLVAPAPAYILAFLLAGSAAFSPDGAAGMPFLATIFLLVGLALALVVFVFTLLPGTKGENKYGPDPYGADLDQVFA